MHGILTFQHLPVESEVVSGDLMGDQVIVLSPHGEKPMGEPLCLLLLMVLEILNTTTLWDGAKTCKNPVNHGHFYFYQLVTAGFLNHPQYHQLFFVASTGLKHQLRGLEGDFPNPQLPFVFFGPVRSHDSPS